MEKKELEKLILKRIEQGQALISPERHNEWERNVIRNSSNLYYGYDIDCALEIMTKLENGTSMEEAIQIFNNQHHSGLSNASVRRLLFDFSSKGPEFWEATAYGEIAADDRILIEAKKQENIQLARNNQQKSTKPKLQNI